MSRALHTSRWLSLVVTLSTAACPPFETLDLAPDGGEGEGEGEPACVDVDASTCAPFEGDALEPCADRGVASRARIGRVPAFVAAVGAYEDEVFVLDGEGLVWDRADIEAGVTDDPHPPRVGLTMDVARSGALLVLLHDGENTFVEWRGAPLASIVVGPSPATTHMLSSRRHGLAALSFDGDRALVVIDEGTEVSFWLVDAATPSAIEIERAVRAEGQEIAVARRFDSGATGLVAAVAMDQGAAFALRRDEADMLTLSEAASPLALTDVALVIDGSTVSALGRAADEVRLQYVGHSLFENGFTDVAAGEGAPPIEGMRTHATEGFVAGVNPTGCLAFAGKRGFVAHGRGEEVRALGRSFGAELRALDAEPCGALWTRAADGSVARYDAPPCVDDAAVQNAFGAPSEAFTLDPNNAAPDGGAVHALLDDGRYLVGGPATLFALAPGDAPLVVDVTPRFASEGAQPIVFAHAVGGAIVVALGDGSLTLWNGEADSIDFSQSEAELPLTEMQPEAGLHARGIQLAVDARASTSERLVVWAAGKDRADAQLQVQRCTLSAPAALDVACGEPTKLDVGVDAITDGGNAFRLRGFALDDGGTRAAVRTSVALHLLTLDGDTAIEEHVVPLADIPGADAPALADAPPRFVRDGDDVRVFIPSSSPDGLRTVDVDDATLQAIAVDAAVGITHVVEAPRGGRLLGAGGDAFFTIDEARLVRDAPDAATLMTGPRPLGDVIGVAAGRSVTFVADELGDVWELPDPPAP